MPLWAWEEQEKEAGEAWWGLSQPQGKLSSEQKGDEIIEEGMGRETNTISLRFDVAAGVGETSQKI